MLDIVHETAEMQQVLARSLQFESVSGHEKPFTEFVADWARSAGFTVDLWQSSEQQLADYPLSQVRHIPLAGRPTLVITHPANREKSSGRSLLFNAHADVVAAPDPQRWTHPPFGGVLADGKFFGRGACDVKGPMVSALGAMLAVKRAYPRGLDGDLSLELIPGEEDCVGLGTLTSLARGYRADGVIVLEPTEDQPRCASRGGCRFEIVCHGRSVHGTVKWLGSDAIAALRKVLEALDAIETDWNDRDADPMFAAYPIARPITVDTIQAGEWQGMVSDRASCAGYLELLPGDEITEMMNRFDRTLRNRVMLRDEPLPKGFADIEIKFSEIYRGYCTSSDNSLCQLARVESGLDGLIGFNSGCEAGLRATVHGTPTLVWGPGSLAQAHAIDEYVQWSSVQHVAQKFAEFAVNWCGAT